MQKKIFFFNFNGSIWPIACLKPPKVWTGQLDLLHVSHQNMLIREFNISHVEHKNIFTNKFDLLHVKLQNILRGQFDPLYVSQKNVNGSNWPDFQQNWSVNLAHYRVKYAQKLTQCMFKKKCQQVKCHSN